MPKAERQRPDPPSPLNGPSTIIQQQPLSSAYYRPLKTIKHEPIDQKQGERKQGPAPRGCDSIDISGPADEMSGNVGKDSKGTVKTRWSPSEDTILLSLLEDLIKSHLWEAIKADGRLMGRGSYGCRYHAVMLLKQGLSKGSHPK